LFIAGLAFPTGTFDSPSDTERKLQLQFGRRILFHMCNPYNIYKAREVTHFVWY